MLPKVMANIPSRTNSSRREATGVAMTNRYEYGASIKATLPPAGQVEHGFPQGLAWYRAGVYTYAANRSCTVDDSNIFAKLCSLDGSGFTCWPTADDYYVKFLHCVTFPGPGIRT